MVNLIVNLVLKISLFMLTMPCFSFYVDSKES